MYVSSIISDVREKYSEPEERFFHSINLLSAKQESNFPCHATAVKEWQLVCLTTVSRCICSRDIKSTPYGGAYIMKNRHNGIKIVAGITCCLLKFSAPTKRKCQSCHKHNILPSKPAWTLNCRDCKVRKYKPCRCCHAKCIPSGYGRNLCTSCDRHLERRKRANRVAAL